jgi:hypothetical protein
MFDNINNQKNSQPGSPIGGGENKPTGAGKVAEDIFADSDQAPSAPSSFGSQSAKPPIFQSKPPIPAEGGAGEALGSGNNMKQILVLGGIVLAAAAVLAGGWYGYKFFSAKETPEAEVKNEPATGEEDKKDAGNANQPAMPGDGNQAATPPLDSDHDGLSDEEESALGMDPKNVDSDDDGLFDREEVKVYKTDPLKKDTDGDGYLDGEEVKKGYNPKGAGKLYKID